MRRLMAQLDLVAVAVGQAEIVTVVLRCLGMCRSTLARQAGAHAERMTETLLAKMGVGVKSAEPGSHKETSPRH